MKKLLLSLCVLGFAFAGPLDESFCENYDGMNESGYIPNITDFEKMQKAVEEIKNYVDKTKITEKHGSSDWFGLRFSCTHDCAPGKVTDKNYKKCIEKGKCLKDNKKNAEVSVYGIMNYKLIQLSKLFKKIIITYHKDNFLSGGKNQTDNKENLGKKKYSTLSIACQNIKYKALKILDNFNSFKIDVKKFIKDKTRKEDLEAIQNFKNNIETFNNNLNYTINIENAVLSGDESSIKGDIQD
jgi:hypothetical protein